MHSRVSNSQTVFILSAIDYSELTYERPNRPEYTYPDWGVAIGWSLAALSGIWIPIVALYKWIKNGATMEVCFCILFYGIWN